MGRQGWNFMLLCVGKQVWSFRLFCVWRHFGSFWYILWGDRDVVSEYWVRGDNSIISGYCFILLCEGVICGNVGYCVW